MATIFRDLMTAKQTTRPAFVVDNPVNLLLSTLLVAAAPFVPCDTYQPQARPRTVIAASVNLLTSTLQGQDQFFGGPGCGPDYDWPTPPAGKRVCVVADPPNLLASTIAGQDQFFGPAGKGPCYDWPTPAAGRRTCVVADPPNLLLTTLAGQDQLPFRQSDWPTPAAKRPVQPSFDPVNLLEEELAQPFMPADWPLPRSAPWILPSDAPNLLGTTLGAPPAPPPGPAPSGQLFASASWPLPSAPRINRAALDFQPPNLLGTTLGPIVPPPPPPPPPINRTIQHLTTVVRADYLALGFTDDPGNAPVIDDPSSPGPSSSWGGDPLYYDGSGNPVTGRTQGSRIPIGPGGAKPKRKKKGDGFQPNKNILTEAQKKVGPGVCFQGVIVIRITNPAPDPFGFNGQEPSFAGGGCVSAGGLVPAGGGNFIPTTAGIVPRSVTDAIGPKGMALLTYIKLWLTSKVNLGQLHSTCFGTVTVDQVSPANNNTCTVGVDCSAIPPSVVPPASSVGSIITAA